MMIQAKAWQIRLLAASCMLFSALIWGLETGDISAAAQRGGVSGYSVPLAPGHHVIIVNGAERKLLKINNKDERSVQVNATHNAVPYIDISVMAPQIKSNI